MYDFSLTSTETKSKIATKINPDEKVEGQNTDITQPLGHQMLLFHIHHLIFTSSKSLSSLNLITSGTEDANLSLAALCSLSHSAEPHQSDLCSLKLERTSKNISSKMNFPTFFFFLWGRGMRETWVDT